MRIIAIIALLLLATPAFAEIDINLVEKLDIPTKAGVVYNVEENETNAVTLATIAKYPSPIGTFDIDAGWGIGDQIVGGIAYELGGLEKLGFDIPLGNLLDLTAGIAAVYDVGLEEVNFGVYCTAISVKF